MRSALSPSCTSGDDDDDDYDDAGDDGDECGEGSDDGGGVVEMTSPCRWQRCRDEQHRETRHSRQK